MSKVVSISGGVISDTRIPRQDVIDELRRLLEAAEAGEIVGLALSYNYGDKSTGHCVIGVVSYSMIGHLEMVKQIVIDDLRK